jgi:hypothetical protein
MSDIIYYKNGEETFRISPPTDRTKTPKTKLEVKKMTEPKFTLELTLDELHMLDKYVEYCEETKEFFEKLKNAYPQPKMHLKNEGEFSIVYYDNRTYCRLQLPAASFWYIETIDGYGGCALEMIEDIKTKNELESQWLMNDVKYQNDEEPYCPDEPEYYDEVESDIDENKEKPKTLYNLIDRWWMDVFCGINTDWDMETSIEDLVDRVELWNMRNKNT